MLKKNKLLVIVFDNRLEIFLPSSLIFNFSSSFILNMELLDQINFEKDLKKFLDQNKIKNKSFYFILDDSFIFWKKQEKKEDEGEKNNFFDLVPLSLEQKGEKKVSFEKEEVFISYNKSILESIIRCFLAKNNQIKGIYPFFAVEDFSNQKIDISLFDEKKIKKEFLIEQTINIEKKDNKRKLAIFILFFLFFLFLGIIFYLVLLKNESAFKKQKKELPKVLKITPTLTPTPTIFYLPFEKITIEIQNGSLRLGEAKKLKEKLEEKGYKVIKIGNAKEKILQTKLFTKNNIKEEFIASLSAFLKESYQLATPESNLDYFNASDSADILIVIGEK